MSPAPILRSAAAGTVHATRVLARTRHASAEGFADERLEQTPFAATGRSSEPIDVRIGALRVTLAATSDGECATWSLRVQNDGREALRVESLGLGFAWRAPDLSQLRFLRQGYQSWSYAAGAALDDAGAPPFPSGPWLRGFHHGTWEVPADRAGWWESDGMTVMSAGAAACSAGGLESGVAFAVVHLRRDGDAVRVEIEQRIERPLDPGESALLEPVRIALGSDVNALLEAHAEAQGTRAGARACAPFQAGWCSWYHFFHDVTEDAFIRNLDALVAARSEIPIELVQLDDGYQRAIGDWLETSEKFPSGLPAVARAVRAAGFTPGLWTAPFCVTPESRVYETHREWLLGDPDGNGDLRGLHHGMWTKDGWVFVLDATQPAVVAHLEGVFRTLVEMGFPYHKIDFLYTQALRATAHDPRVTRAARLRRGLAAVRAGAGDEAFVLGCGCPLGPAVGLVDGMRIGPDTAPYWHVMGPKIAGLEATLPSGRNALRNTLARAFQHRRLWLNDPDCLMARSNESKLTRDEVRALAASIAVTGGMTIFSDDMPALTGEDRALVRDTIALAREVDEAAHTGTARPVDLLGAEIAPAVVARAGADWLVALFNDAEEPRRRALDLAANGVEVAKPAPIALLGSAEAEVAGHSLAVLLPPHGAALYRVRGAPRLAVFCDFDGTFAVQDVGSTIARRYASARRTELWPRLESGELDAWAYNMELLEGLALPEAELEAFLRTIELDPGARELVAWCERECVPFRVLSDGFDRNLDRLQELHGVRFAYDANGLRYEDGVWRLTANAPDPACGCGTGTCKRARIAAFRVRHPGVPVVHIGNGRISDLCASEAADRVFAKDSLADVLTERGMAFDRFATLRDVVTALERWLASDEFE
jgi:alpha-galactosidase